MRFIGNQLRLDPIRFGASLMSPGSRSVAQPPFADAVGASVEYRAGGELIVSVLWPAIETSIIVWDHCQGLGLHSRLQAQPHVEMLHIHDEMF